MCSCLSHAPYRGPGPQPRHVPWLGIEPTTLWFAGLDSIHWATPARAGICSWTSTETALVLSHPLGKKAQTISVPKVKVSGSLPPLYPLPHPCLCQRKAVFPLIQGQFQQNYKFSEDSFPSSHVVPLKPPILILRESLAIRHCTPLC